MPTIPSDRRIIGAAALTAAVTVAVVVAVAAVVAVAVALAGVAVVAVVVAHRVTAAAWRAPAAAIKR
jgi:hypothetical protein